MTRILLIELRPWISVIQILKKPSFKLYKSNVMSVDISRVEAQGIFALNGTLRKPRQNRPSRHAAPSQKHGTARDTSTPSKCGVPYWEGTRHRRGSRR